MAQQAMSGGADGEGHPDFGKAVRFEEVFHQEISLINKRRAQDARGSIELETECKPDSSGEPVFRPKADADVIGLALSGGGIRSSAFCLGALQALDEAGVLERIDYLSTVSGGGYIGCALTAATEAEQAAKWKFPFPNKLQEDEPPSVQHIRDHSNYLFANGGIDFLHNAAIYARGLVTNAVVVLPFLLVAAAVTLICKARPGAKPAEDFVVTGYLTVALLIATVLWGIYRSRKGQERAVEIPDVPGSGPDRLKKLLAWIAPATVVGALVIAVLLFAFIELQPFVLDAMLDPYAKGFFGFVSQGINTIVAVFAPVAAVMAFLRNNIGEFVKRTTESSRGGDKVKRYAAKAAIYLAALIVPLLVWLSYLYIAAWGICINEVELTCAHPKLLDTFAAGTYAIFAFVHLGPYLPQPATLLYLVLAVLLVGITRGLRPNANSLHPLYRDHLAKAFLFKPRDKMGKDANLDPFRPLLSKLSGAYGPYHLINAALNVQNSRTANKRGRNADFFLFSQKFVGSKTTGYVATSDIETVALGLDLAAAMAVSGAAASSNMGAESIKPLTPTLALLNIRLGFWLRNPKRLHEAAERKQYNPLANYYFLLELFGLLNEKRTSIYLTDGGHIENLGIYELFRRRCRVVIAVDAEADPEMAFGSLNTMERYALIDLGVRIDLPWQYITNETRATSEAIDKSGDAPAHRGPHCAIGEITYPDQRKGILIYIKSSLTGDENDFVYHYKKSYNAFPHETTLDQMFSEEQFEAYRALGFHATNRLFDRSDKFAYPHLADMPLLNDHLAHLDKLFPRKNTPQTDSHDKRQTFVQVLADMEKARKKAERAAAAKVIRPSSAAEAATKE
jgi:hypothetical protein